MGNVGRGGHILRVEGSLHLDGGYARNVLAVDVVERVAVLDNHAEAVRGNTRWNFEHHVVARGVYQHCIIARQLTGENRRIVREVCQNRLGAGVFGTLVGAVEVGTGAVVHVETLQGNCRVTHIQAHLADALAFPGIRVGHVKVDGHPVIGKVLSKAIHGDFQPVVALVARSGSHVAAVHERRIGIGRGVRKVVAVGLQVDTVVGARIAVTLDAAVAYAHGACAGVVVEAHNLAVIVAVGPGKATAHIVPVRLREICRTRNIFRRKPRLRGTHEVERERRLGAGLGNALRIGYLFFRFGGVAPEGRKAVVAEHDILPCPGTDIVTIKAAEHHIVAVARINVIGTGRSQVGSNIVTLVGDHQRIKVIIYFSKASIAENNIVSIARSNFIRIHTTHYDISTISCIYSIMSAIMFRPCFNGTIVFFNLIFTAIANNNIVSTVNINFITIGTPHHNISVAMNVNIINATFSISLCFNFLQARIYHIRDVRFIVFSKASVTKYNISCPDYFDRITKGSTHGNIVSTIYFNRVYATNGIILRLNFQRFIFL